LSEGTEQQAAGSRKVRGGNIKKRHRSFPTRKKKILCGGPTLRDKDPRDEGERGGTGQKRVREWNWNKGLDRGGAVPEDRTHSAQPRETREKGIEGELKRKKKKREARNRLTLLFRSNKGGLQQWS